MKKVYINMNWLTSAVTEMDIYLDMLKEAGLEVYVNNCGRTMTREEAMADLPGYQIYLGSTVPFDGPLLDALPDLKLIARTGVGYDTIDVPAATARGVAVTITPGAGAEAVSEFAMALMITVARRVVELDRSLRQGAWERLAGPALWNKKLGIIGMGRIGKKMAEISRGFNMKIMAYDPCRDEEFAKRLNVTYCDSLEEMLKEADFITIHAPLTDETKDMIDTKQFALMKPGAILINCARGGIVNEKALGEALKSNRIAGAGFDVFEQEPIKADNPLFKLENLVMTPHNAGTSLEGKNSVVKAAVINVVEYATGKQPYGVLNPEALAGTGAAGGKS